jgi:hypothetical protein
MLGYYSDGVDLAPSSYTLTSGGNLDFQGYLVVSSA